MSAFAQLSCAQRRQKSHQRKTERPREESNKPTLFWMSGKWQMPPVSPATVSDKTMTTTKLSSFVCPHLANMTSLQKWSFVSDTSMILTNNMHDALCNSTSTKCMATQSSMSQTGEKSDETALSCKLHHCHATGQTYELSNCLHPHEMFWMISGRSSSWLPPISNTWQLWDSNLKEQWSCSQSWQNLTPMPCHQCGSGMELATHWQPNPPNSEIFLCLQNNWSLVGTAMKCGSENFKDWHWTVIIAEEQHLDHLIASS